MSNSQASFSRRLPAGSRGHVGGEGVDRVISTSPWSYRRFRIVLGLATSIVVALLMTRVLIGKGGNLYVIDRSEVTIATVTQGMLSESLSSSGSLLPRTTVFLDVVEGGRVESIEAEEGVVIEEGQPILRLSNNDLVLRLMSVNTQRLDQRNQLREARFRLEQHRLLARQELAELDHQIERLKRKVVRNEKLWRSELLSLELKEQTEDELAFNELKRNLARQTQEQKARLIESQIDQLAEEVESIVSSQNLLQKILDNLEIRAPISGQLTELNAEIGELVAPGSRLGTIDQATDGFKIRAEIDEFYVNRVHVGQKGTTLPLDGKTYALEVINVFPSVKDGNFRADLEFVDSPPDSRRGRTIGFTLHLSDPVPALIIPRGPFYRTTGGHWVYVVTDDGEAKRRSIRLGRSSKNSLEVLSGLSSGDRIIVSAYEAFRETDSLFLQ